MSTGPSGSASDPLIDLSSKDMACNVGGTKGVQRVVAVDDGAVLSFKFQSYPDDASKMSYDPGHQGPCAVYLKKVDSAIKDEGAGDGWFKIFAEGYDASTSQWCNQKLIDNKGRLSIRLPKGLQGGDYLIRPELVTLHAANEGEPQFYTSCAQAYIKSSGNLVPESTVSIPGEFKHTDESLTWNIYDGMDNAKYPLPGPKVAKLVAGSSTSSTGQTEGLLPKECIAVKGDWCGKQVPSYTDETSCWKSSEDCYAQADTCYANKIATGNKPCESWSKQLCEVIQADCRAGKSGPPKVDLLPKLEKIDNGLVFEAQNEGASTSPSNQENKPAEEVKPSASATPAAAQSTPEPTPAVEKEAVVAEDNSKPAEDPKPDMVISAPPATTPSPTTVICPPGFQCVTKHTTAVVTKVKYETVYPKQKRQSLHHRRHMHSL
ncbi:glycosyl hydrolase family 61-domain-containing protein [Massariosphaeria phaeospora]|uniref:AA9 family lytic polysaccharide monooxygenase n=1 Tax=Massariosphaeria phaeospora TaxID=100035 RepID=A0A7C8M317_9PLEO|nr:glycosyl hydrolase family 61-domain-containing protein [Massariosphaeria phaeospora]